MRFNAVSPGLIDTPVHAHMPEAERRAMFAQAAEGLPARRVGQPSDVAAAVLFLTANPFVTGTTVAVDGGGLLT